MRARSTTLAASLTAGLVAVAGKQGVKLTPDESAGIVALVLSVAHLVQSGKGKDWRTWLKFLLSGPATVTPPAPPQLVQSTGGVTNL